MITTLGIDCSHWQNDKSTAQKMDFKKAAAAGAHFVFIKVSERGGIDVDYEYNWKAAKDAGIPRGGYHFLRWDLPATTQARVFCAALKDNPGELPPAADFEAPAKDGLYPSNSMLLAFLEEVEKILNRRPIIYTSPGFWKSHGNNKVTRVPEQFWKIYPLWIAHYFKTMNPGITKPDIPAPWKDWLFWQYSATGDGLAFGAESKGIDLNLFNGDLIDLQQLIEKTTGQSTTQPPTPPAGGNLIDDNYLQSQINILAQHVKNVEDFLSGFRLP
jgi:lysozyme